jgi:hypothetical protein
MNGVQAVSMIIGGLAVGSLVRRLMVFTAIAIAFPDEDIDGE